LNWIKEFTNVKGSVEDVVQKIGAQLGAVEEVIDLSKKYEGIIVAKIVSCQKHPNADKLSVCWIDDGRKAKGVRRNTQGLVQVVCGAPNARAGLLVAWLPPGRVVPSSSAKEPLTLESRDFRGQMSNGMLASSHELDIGDDHGGIVEIDKSAKPGDDFARLYGFDDQIIDIENKMFTHRPDCFGQLGVAREITGIYHETFNSPQWYVKRSSFHAQSSDHIKGLKVDNRLPKLCPRYMAVAIEGVTVGASPLWLQSYLSRVGIRPINNIVDMTNYLMVLTGQPLHAFDFDKIALRGKAQIVVRHPKKGETMTLLDGTTIVPRADAVLICDQAKPIALGGVMGGNNSEIDEHTTRLIIECANFDMYNIRKTAMEHGLFTEAVTRFIKGQSPWQCPPVLYQAVNLLRQICPDARAVGQPVDVHYRLKPPRSVAVAADFINARLGTKLSLKDMATLLENVEFKLLSVPADKKRLHVVPPFWRTDIVLPEDLVEEIGRLHGYDHLPLLLPTRIVAPAQRNRLLDFKQQLRERLSAAGANELLTYSFVHGNLLTSVDQSPKDAYQLANALSPDLQYYRLSLLPSLLEKVHPNLKSDMIRGDDNELAIFEINPVHTRNFVDKDGLPIEDQRLALVFAADDKTAQRKYGGAPYYAARTYLSDLLGTLGIVPIFQPAKDHQPLLAISRAAIAPFDKKRAAIVKTLGGDFLGEIGEFSLATRQNLKLPAFTAGFELDVQALLKAAEPNQYKSIPRFPKVLQDITLKVPARLAYGELYGFLVAQLSELTPASSFWTLGLPRIYQSEKDPAHKHVTMRLWISHYERTLQTEEVNQLLDELAAAAHATYQAERV
ncbi:phenylalanine--tRNA ligase subunit beta, partial [Candidatus Saccharibacteria bacterium]|nr:phenylalanine--tRNA ligase subunit beta [Candidatus Saccharibacteria bacterium]